jgi:hypothetical protein
VLAWALVTFVVAVLLFCAGIVSDHSNPYSSRPFAFYLLGVLLMGLSVVLFLSVIVNSDSGL